MKRQPLTCESCAEDLRAFVRNKDGDSVCSVAAIEH